jgi:hypothetical protein
MYQLYYIDRDATLYERKPTQNTGIDPIVELTKIASGSNFEGAIQSKTYNTRILLDFATQITALSQSIVNGEIPKLGSHPLSASVYLTMIAADASDLPLSFDLKAFPVSQSWVMGNGYKIDNPITKKGVSWYYRDAEDPGTRWNTGSAASSGDASTTELLGGGAWMTGSGYEASQSFSNPRSLDVRMNITDITEKWLNGSIANNGLILKRPTADERSGDVFGSIKYYGNETHTIFIPRLEVAWDDTVTSGTGSFNAISSDTYVPYFKNIRPSYRTDDKAILRIGVRPEYPVRNYGTGSVYLTEYRLPTSSYYSVTDAYTNQTVIPYDTKATKISCDTIGSFFKIRMSTLMPERYYRILLKIERNGGDDVQIHDNGYYFKIEQYNGR